MADENENINNLVQQMMFDNKSQPGNIIAQSKSQITPPVPENVHNPELILRHSEQHRPDIYIYIAQKRK